MTYKVVKATSVEDLEAQVVELMKTGWTPLNGGFIEETYSSTPERFLQACVKYPAAKPMEVVIVNKTDDPVLIQAVPAVEAGEEQPQAGSITTPVKTKTAKKKTKARKK